MAKPMFFFTGIYDNVVDADADHQAIRLLYGGMAGAGAGLGAWFGHFAHGTRGDAKCIGALLEPGKAALIVVGIDKDAEQIERAGAAPVA